MSIKYQNLRSFKEGLILLCQSIIETRRITHLHGSAHFKIPFKKTLPEGRDVKDFWIFYKSYFNSKGICYDDEVTLAENNVLKNSEISETLKNNFVNITEELEYTNGEIFLQIGLI